MNHSYERHAFTKDGRHLRETVTLTGADVATALCGGRGDRAAFLELVNRWNRLGLLACDEAAPLYIYIAGESAHG